VIARLMEKIRRRKYMETIIQTQAAVIEELENRCSEKMAYIDKEALKLVSKIGILI